MVLYMPTGSDLFTKRYNQLGYGNNLYTIRWQIQN